MENKKYQDIDINSVISNDAKMDYLIHYLASTNKETEEYLKVNDLESLPFGYTRTDDSYMYVFDTTNLSIDKQDGRMRLTTSYYPTEYAEDGLQKWMNEQLEKGIVYAHTSNGDVALNHLQNN